MKDIYAARMIKLHIGAIGRFGSAVSEVINAAVLIFLKNVIRGIKTCKESPTTLVKKLHQRKALHVNEWNQIFHVENNKLDA